MNKVLLVGSNKLSIRITSFIAKHPNLKLFAMTLEENEELLHILTKHNIETFSNLEQCFQNNFDYIFITEDNLYIEKQLKETFPNSYFFYPKTLNLMNEVISSQFEFSLKEMEEYENVKTMLNSISDGIIVIDESESIQFINEMALDLLNKKKKDVLYKKISRIIPHSRLPYILQTQVKEVNQTFKLNDKQTIITTRIPLFNHKKHLMGAFAIFKAEEEVVQLAEDNTNIKQLEVTLNALIHASGEAISVVDEHGKGLMFNTAYTEITGLSADEVIGKPATVDILEGESIHLQVLQKRRAIHGAEMKVGKYEKDVIVNATPIIVDGKLQGSIAVIKDVSEIKKLSSELKKAKQMIRNLESTYTMVDIIGKSSQLELAKQQALIAAKTTIPTLLKGEQGVGKELFAHVIHNESERKYNKFIRVNCSTIPSSIIKNELFGSEEQASWNKNSVIEKGVFEEANYGTVFLDEVSHLPMQVQKELVNLIENKSIIRIGGNKEISLDVKIIATTSYNLEELVLQNEFDKQLYNLLHHLPIQIPALKERLEDLYDLVSLIIDEKNELYGRNVQGISSDVLYELKRYDWPGNVRELENVIDRAIIFMDKNETMIEEKHLSHFSYETQNLIEQEENFTLQEAVDAFEKQYIGEIYTKNKFNKSKTAKELNISLRNLYYKIDKYELDSLLK